MSPFRTEFRPADYDALVRSLTAEIGARIRPVVAHWPAADVDHLLDEMARIKLKYDGIEVATDPIPAAASHASAPRRPAD